MAGKNCIASAKSDHKETAEEFSNIGVLIAWMKGLVKEWHDKDGNLFCIASTAEVAAKTEDETTIEAGVFAVLREQLGESSHYYELIASLDRMENLVKAGRAGVSHG